MRASLGKLEHGGAGVWGPTQTPRRNSPKSLVCTGPPQCLTVSWVQGPSLESCGQHAQVTQADPWDFRAHVLANTRACPAASPAVPMALRNGEQLSHNNHSLIVPLSWATQQWPKKRKNSLFLHPSSHTGPHPSSKWPVTSLALSPDCISDLCEERLPRTPLKGVGGWGVWPRIASCRGHSGEMLPACPSLGLMMETDAIAGL